MKKICVSTVFSMIPFLGLSAEINISPIWAPSGTLVINTVFDTPIDRLQIGPSGLLGFTQDLYFIGARAQYHFKPLDQSGAYFTLGVSPILGYKENKYSNVYADKYSYYLYALGYDWKTQNSKTIKLGAGLAVPQYKEFDPEKGATAQILDSIPWPYIEFQYGWVL